MDNYRFYQIGAAHRIDGPPKEIKCKDDRAAIEIALVDGRVIEIWDRERLVGPLFPNMAVAPQSNGADIGAERSA